MKQNFPHFPWTQRIRGIDWVTASLFLAALLLHGAAWWLRTYDVPFNVVVLNIAGGIVVVNGGLAVRYSRYEPLLGYIFGGAAVFAQIFLLILLAMARQGVLQ